jgi:hypothetical protein
MPKGSTIAPPASAALRTRVALIEAAMSPNYGLRDSKVAKQVDIYVA